MLRKIIFAAEAVKVVSYNRNYANWIITVFLL